jgi:hypothetical protein
MAPKPKPYRIAFILMILAMVATSLMITSWAAQRDWATPIPPMESTYRSQHLLLY